jgi:hypothetical protein
MSVVKVPEYPGIVDVAKALSPDTDPYVASDDTTALN